MTTSMCHDLSLLAEVNELVYCGRLVKVLIEEGRYGGVDVRTNRDSSDNSFRRELLRGNKYRRGKLPGPIRRCRV